MPSPVAVGIICRSTTDNPWFDRLQHSIEQVPSGLGARTIVEQGPLFTKVEKKIRLVAACDADYLIYLEDDTEVLLPEWVTALLRPFFALPNVAVVGPLEAGYTVGVEEAEEMCRPQVAEMVTLGGFCMALNLRLLGTPWDVRVQTMDDLWVCLRARNLGYRVVRTHETVVRHTKMPWAEDGTPPWQQGDRSRFGENDAYYQQEAHRRKRLGEARFLIEQFGDMARQALPPELLAVLEPERVPVGLPSVQAVCSGCHQPIDPTKPWVMDPDRPFCVACFEAKR